MKTKYYHTLVALALLAAMWGGFTYWEKRKSRESEKTASTSQEKLLAVESSHIRSLTIRSRGGESVTCQREGEQWAIVAPAKLPADPSAVSGVLNSLTGATVDQVVDPQPADLSVFGLDRPAATLEVTTDTKPEKFTLRLGDETPTSAGVYAQVAGNARVFTLANYLKSSLDKKLFDLRDKRAVTLDAAQLQRLEVTTQGKRWTLVRNPEGVWNLDLPPAVRADRFTAEDLVDRLGRLSMKSIVSENKQSTASYGFAAPALKLQLTAPQGSQTLVVGKKDNGNYYAMNSALDPVFTVESSFVTQYEKDPADLRDKNLFSFSTFEVKRLEVDSPAGARILEQQAGNKWKQTVPAAKDVATDKVEALLNKLRDLRAESFPAARSLETFGLAKPAYRFKVEFGEKKETETVEASRVGDNAYARRSTDVMASKVSKATLDEIEKALQEL
jgi:hypothetical protein